MNFASLRYQGLWSVSRKRTYCIHLNPSIQPSKENRRNRLIKSKGPGTTLEFALAIVRKAKDPDMEKALREGMVIGHS